MSLTLEDLDSVVKSIVNRAVSSYEENNGFTTERFILYNKYLGKDYAILFAEKSDGSATVFAVVKQKKGITTLYFCPSKNHIEQFLPSLFVAYQEIEEYNKKNRRR